MGWKGGQAHGCHRSWEDRNGCRRARDSPRGGGRSLRLLAEGEAAEGHGDGRGRKAGPVWLHRRELGSARPWGWGVNAEAGRESADSSRTAQRASRCTQPGSVPPRAHTRGGAPGLTPRGTLDPYQSPCRASTHVPGRPSLLGPLCGTRGISSPKQPAGRAQAQRSHEHHSSLCCLICGGGGGYAKPRTVAPS